MKEKIFGIIISGIMLSPISVSAASYDEYPASDFQPTVVYQDDSVKSSGGSNGPTTVFDPDYPAASFQPKVVFADPSATRQSSSSMGETSSFDPDYPAANFKPKVIYP